MTRHHMPAPHLAAEYPRNRLGPLEPDCQTPPSPDRSHGRSRRWVFRAWVTASAMVAVFVGLIGPLTSDGGEIAPMVGMVVPALMVLLLGAGLGWWMLFVADPRQEGD